MTGLGAAHPDDMSGMAPRWIQPPGDCLLTGGFHFEGLEKDCCERNPVPEWRFRRLYCGQRDKEAESSEDTGGVRDAFNHRVLVTLVGSAAF
jgi:hypothetical protein